MSWVKGQYTRIGEKSPGNLPLLEPERDDDGNPIGDPGATLQEFIEDIGNVLDPGKEILCEMTGQDYGSFLNAMRENPILCAQEHGGAYNVLAYIQACLRRKKILLSQDAKIEPVNDLLWRITDRESQYFVEDTGFSIMVFRYGNLYSGLDGALNIEKVLNPSKSYGLPKEQLDFIQANRFYDRKETEREFYLKPNAHHVPPSPKIEKIDFHQMIVTTQVHPSLFSIC